MIKIKKLGKFNNVDFNRLESMYEFKSARITRETLRETLKKNNVKFDTVMNPDINSDYSQ